MLLIGCRENEARDRGYALLVYPQEGGFALYRFNAGDAPTRLVQPTLSSAIRRGTQTNRLELICSGNTIAARINGTQVASVQDSSYGEGRMWIGAVGFEGATVDARFDNLVVTQQ